MTIRFFNTEKRKMEDFVPLQEGIVKMYTCGPTVYNFAHIGNIRTFLFEDLLRRFLKFMNYQVTQVMNITDIEDKIIRDYAASGLGFKGFTQKYTEHFFEDLDLLNIERAEIYPRATEHIPEMIQLIQTLLDKKHAYQTEDGSIYFRINSFEKYGRLANVDTSQLRHGVRIDVDEYEKDDLHDFALWKGWNDADGDIWYDAPFGKGRPGWHLECSAMAMKYLGNHFDIHTGGVDNIFPHHENEIAQSECASGEQYVNYWMHSEHLIVEGKKMSKSMGNFFTLRDLVEKGYSAMAIRYLLLSTHYRQQLNFTFDGLKASQTCVDRLRDFQLRLVEVVDKQNSLSALSEVSELLAKTEKSFIESLSDDLSISQALAGIFDMMNQTNKLMAEDKLASCDATKIVDLLTHLDVVLGIFATNTDNNIPAEVLTLVDERATARQEKNWSKADEIRDKLAELGFVVEDTKDGARVKPIN